MLAGIPLVGFCFVAYSYDEYRENNDRRYDYLLNAEQCLAENSPLLEHSNVAVAQTEVPAAPAP